MTESRGCGDRQENGLYMVCGLSPYGQPLEHFLVDPAKQWTGGQLRSPMLQNDSQGVNHVLIGVGQKFYPYVPDFAEEVRVMGASKRIPRNFDFSSLTPESKMLLIHPRAIPKFSHTTVFQCPRDGRSGNHSEQGKPVSGFGHECLGALWPLSLLQSHGRVHEVGPETFVSSVLETRLVTTPSTRYRATFPKHPVAETRLTRYVPGIFLQLPIQGFEFINRKGKVPKDLKERAANSNIRLEVKEK